MLLVLCRCDLDLFPHQRLVAVEMVALTLVLVLVFGFVLGCLIGLAFYVVIAGTCPCRQRRLGRGGLGAGLGDYRAWMRRQRQRQILDEGGG